MHAEPEGIIADGIVQGDQEGVGLGVSGHGEGAAVFTTGRGRIAEGLAYVERLVADSVPSCVTVRTRCWKTNFTLTSD